MAGYGMDDDNFVCFALDRAGWRRLIHGLWRDPRKAGAPRPPPAILVNDACDTYTCTACQRTSSSNRDARRHWSDVHIRAALAAAHAAQRVQPIDATT